MGLIELCLLSLLSPQQPSTDPGAAAAAPTHATPAPAPEVPTGDPSAEAAQDPAAAQQPGGQKPAGESTPSAPASDGQPTDAPDAAAQGPVIPDPVAHLKTLEPAGEYADPAELAKLAQCNHAKVAARATWLLGKGKTQEHHDILTKIATASPHAVARLQALQALKIRGEVTATSTAIDALADDDLRVRTVAVQVLAKHRRPAAVEPLLAMIQTSAQAGLTAADSGDAVHKGPATDVQAALLTLADMGATEHLLRMAIAVGDGEANDTGEALAYAFQVLSPQLDEDRETTVLVAVLGHKESMLRRYAITRLAELDSKIAITALEGRLAKEGNELRPLVEVAIAQIRNEGAAQPKDELARARSNAKALWQRGKSWWLSLDPVQQGIYAGIPVVLILLLWMLRRAARRRAREADAEAATALVQPSDEYLDQEEYEDDGEYEYDEEYEDEGEDQDFEEAFEGEGDGEYADEDQEQYDTSGWDDDEETVPPDDGNPEDELFR